ncbi:Glycine betaine transport system permease protein OpuAB [Ruegeria denitrificans]|uniref:Glycine betaine transport system permease protein OpuAB n=1 Tax=Ruegeria denitrificans TaxID=1715692 RepID=A0A0P1I868_9RHOB|nr:ABC transporter permease subunit [Ruegeria denitrificans]CUJ97007.1 Glycine betaine transport system permease protein OpuAB [Ruegeria denitrificans]
MDSSSDRSLVVWLAVTVLVAICVVFAKNLGPLVIYPDALVLPVTDPMNTAMRWFVVTFGWFFKAISWLLDWPILLAKSLLHAVPWAAWFVLWIYLALRAGGRGLAIFTAISLMYMVTFGFWSQSMNSFALVVVSIPMAVALGFALGTWGFLSDRAYRIIMPILDLMQTVPAFAYLLPILLLFGFGTTVGLVASILFAFPPMVRNTIVGLRGVPDEVIESGLMSGATPSQLFWRVRVPTAQRQILLGVNQTTMASLSMVIIASIIGGTNDIGWEVLSTMRKAQFGESLLAGIVIALMAMVLDRITWGFAVQSSPTKRGAAGWIICAVLFGAAWLLALLFPPFKDWPEAWVLNPAPAMNAGLEWIFVEFRTVLEAIKRAALFYLMLPIKIGLSQAVSPFTWGFAMTPAVTTGYSLIVAAVAAYFSFKGKLLPALWVILFALVLYSGLTGLAWVALSAVIVALAWQAGGKNLALWALAGVAFLLLTGIWEPSVISLYLCGVGVLLSFIFGSAIGTWASENDTVSRMVRPVIDTLQTMPLFVILIPFVMVFKIGEFTALLAIIVYAIVPAIRYTEHGLRNLPHDVIEAATAIGTTPRQLLWQVKLPLAVPSIMLGLNQTIMFGISMLVITALVGTDDLGQQIYIGLGDGDFGVGMTAGIGMAIIAMIADRITQGFSQQIQARLGVKLNESL